MAQKQYSQVTMTEIAQVMSQKKKNLSSFKLILSTILLQRQKVTEMASNIQTLFIFKCFYICKMYNDQM
jgi:hypothetical protein